MHSHSPPLGSFMDRSSYFLLDKTTHLRLTYVMQCRVVSRTKSTTRITSLLVAFPHAELSKEKDREGEAEQSRCSNRPLCFMVLFSLSLSVSLCLCDSFMVHLAALIWVPFLTLFSKFNTSRIHMHNVMRDLLYEYEYYRAALGSPLRINSPA